MSVASMQDCSGVQYRIVQMPGNGLCGYSCLSYALTGDKRKYAEVIENLLQAFYANPHVFLQQTEFGRKNDNLSVYDRELRQAVATVHRQSVPRIFWLEDVHLLSFSMLFDVTVFVYHSCLLYTSPSPRD